MPSSTKRAFRSFLPTLSLLMLLCVAMAGFTAAHYARTSDEVELPIRVMHHDVSEVGGRYVAPGVTVNVSNASSVAKLYLQAHGLTYDGKASVRINGGPWTDLDNNTVTCRQPDAEFGCIGGAYATVRLTLPISGVVEGANTIEFSFNGTDGFSSGYRVLAMDLLRSDGSSALDGTTFTHEDPSAWTAPFPNTQDIEAGEALYHARRLLRERPGGPSIVASCADCHASDGRDLKYFNYSNESIVVRSRFHGLSQQEGQQIASWIRAIALEREDGSSYEAPGRPWNPPYQPGPGLDEKPVEEWAAGAGLEAVLDRDADMLAHLFPNGADSDGDEVAATSSTLNMRELPTDLQFADWNTWLPVVHPLDFREDAFLSSDANDAWENAIPEALAGGVGPLLQGGDDGNAPIERLLENFHKDVQQFRMKKVRGGKGKELAVAARSIQLWSLVKTWELMQAHHLEDKAPSLHAGGEPRSWIGNSRPVFDVSPHITGNFGTTSYSTEMRNAYFSHEWYYKQVVMGAGSRAPKAIKPVDWKYQFQFTDGLADESGRDAAVRYAASYIKMLQMLDNENELGKDGWYLRHVTPFWIMRTFTDMPVLWQDVDATTQRAIAEAVIGAWLDKAREYPASAWPRRKGKKQGEWRNEFEPADYNPKPCRRNDQCFDGGDKFNYADHLFRTAAALEAMQADAALVDRLARWGEEMWPRGDWEQWFGDGEEEDDDGENEAPTVRITNLSDGDTVPASPDVFIETDAFDPDGSVARVAFYAGSTKLGERTEAPFEYVWQDASPGRYTLTARATDDAGAETTSPPVTIDVVPGDEEANHDLTLARGWNLISSWVAPDDADLEAVFAEAIENVVLVKDGQGRAFIPSAGIDNIGDWDPMEGYMVYLSAQDTVVMEGASLDEEPPAVALSQGWNQVPYLRQEPLPIGEALESALESIILVKDYAGRTFIPAFGIDNIGTMEPGQGYKVYVTEDVQINYPDGTPTANSLVHPSASLAMTAVPDTAPDKAPAAGVPASSVILVRAPGMAEGQRITAWTEGRGVVGEGVVQGGAAAITVRGDEYATTAKVEGAQDGDPIVLKVADPDDAEAPQQTLTLASLNDGLSGQPSPALRYERETMLVAEVEAQKPRTFTLGGNYPNPFRRTTSIEYSLPEAAEVTLTVYDVLGRRTALLVDDERKEAGTHKASFKGAALPSGVYLYRLRAGDYEASGKMTLLK